MKNISKILITTFLLTLFIISGSVVNAEINEVEILAINDFHGHLAANSSDPGIGKIAGYIRTEQKLHPGEILLLSDGDMFQGTMESNLLFGASVIDEMNYLGFAAMTIGNHEFDWGIDKLNDRMKQANFPFLGANIYEKGSKELMAGVKPYIIKDINGIKIAVIGLATLETPQTTSASNVATLDFAAATPIVDELNAQLRRQGVDIIVLLSHMSTFQDYTNRASSNEITGEGADATSETFMDVDVSITGHSHKFVNGWVDNIPTLQAYWAGRALAKIVINYDTDNKKIVSIESKIIDLRACDMADDKEAMNIYQRDGKEIIPLSQEVIGYSKNGLNKSYNDQCQMGDWVTDTIRNGLKVDVVLLNNECLRQGLDAGAITMGEFYKVLPFDDFLYTMTMSGQQLKELFEYAIETKGTAGCTYFSGVNIVYDRTKSYGQRIVKITDLQNKPISVDKIYSVGTIDFLVSGGDGFTMFKDASDIKDTGINARDYLVQQVRAMKTIDCVIDKRLLWGQ